MSGDYQLRQDVDKLIDDIYGVNSRVVVFDDKSNLRGISTKYFKEGTIDAILQYLDVGGSSSGGSGGGADIDLSNYVKKSDVSFNVSLESNGTMIFNLNVGD